MNTVPVDWEDRIRRASRRKRLRYDPARSVDVGEVRRGALWRYLWRRRPHESLRQCWVREVRFQRDMCADMRRFEVRWRRIVRSWGDENRRMGLYD